jgi:arsenite methyltransferase
MNQKELTVKEGQVELKVLNSGPEPCCGNTALDTDVDQSSSIRDAVQDFYAQRALNSDSCCGEGAEPQFYEADLLENMPDDVAGFSLGCGDPITLANLQPGEVVLDLGSGGGLDCFLSSKQVGEDGYVIGIDMTPEMLERARKAADKMGIHNVEFRKGFLEDMPVDDDSVDVIISNCVINLSPDKPQVFAEMLRTLKPGGRVSVSDIVTSGELPEALRQDMQAWGACVSGALDMDDYIAALEGVGFVDVNLVAKAGDGELLEGIPQGTIFSASITASKP